MVGKPSGNAGTGGSAAGPQLWPRNWSQPQVVPPGAATTFFPASAGRPGHLSLRSQGPWKTTEREPPSKGLGRWAFSPEAFQKLRANYQEGLEQLNLRCFCNDALIASVSDVTLSAPAELCGEYLVMETP